MRCNPVSSDNNPRRSRSAAGWISIGTTIAIVLAVCTWMISLGSGKLLTHEVLGQFYDGQADSLLDGHWDVAPQAIEYEAFVHNGRTYGYFGFMPALPRIPLNVVFPSLHGCWSRASLLAAILVAMLGMATIIRHQSDCRTATIAFLLCVGLGSPLVFIATRASVYHEAIAWGTALAILFFGQSLRYLRSPGLLRLVVMCLIAFGCFFSRASVGLGPLITLMLICLATLLRRSAFGRTAPRAHGILAGSAFVAIVAMFVAINQMKFGTWLDGMPFRLYHEMAVHPERMRQTAGKACSIANLRTNAAAYLSPDSISLQPHFPWIYLAGSFRVFAESHHDVLEPCAGIPVGMPALALLALIGIVRGIRPPNSAAISLLGATAGCAGALLCAGISQRYLCDFLPLLVLAAGLGLPALNRITRPIWLLLVIASIWANLSFAIVYQRLTLGQVPDSRRAEFRALCERIDRGL